MSPVVWKFIAPGLSAGRVQSVALAMVVDRERARLMFKSAEYWGVTANVTAEGQPGEKREARERLRVGLLCPSILFYSILL